MRWFNRRRRRADAAHGEDIDHALQQADRALEDAKALRSRAEGIGDKLRDTRRRNHFAEAFIHAARRL